MSEIKWQPVVMIVNRRLECQCGALAVFVSGHIPDEGEYNQLEEVDVWCQACYEKMQAENNELDSM